MAGAGYEEKRGPNMGSRSMVRHGTQGAASAGGLALLLQALVDAGKLDIHGAFLALAILTPVLTTLLKLWDGLDGLARLKALLNRVAPLVIAIGLLNGCAIQLGTMKPEQFATLGGGTMIACETKGITIALGDADLCSNSARGGKVSKTFSDMTLGVVRTVGAAVAGFFGGAGQGMAMAIESQPDPAQSIDPEMSPRTAVEFPGTTTVPLPDTESQITNPFVSPDPE